MKLQPKLTQVPQLTNRIVMTPKLQQAIKVLMMPQLELRQFIEQELEQNPLLEIDEEFDTFLSEQDYDPSVELNNREENIAREDTSIDIDWDSVFDDRPIKLTQEHDEYGEIDAPEPDIAQSVTLHEFLYNQLQLTQFTEIERAIGELIIGNLNDDGELELKLFSIPHLFNTDFQNNCVSDELMETLTKNLHTSYAKSKTDIKMDDETEYQIDTIDSFVHCGGNQLEPYKWRLKDLTQKKVYTVLDDGNELNVYQLTLEEIADEVNSTLFEVESVLRKIQETFEPIGIAYRDLKETLSIQINHFEIQHLKHNNLIPITDFVPFQLAKIIVEEYLDDLLKSRISAISQALEIDRSDILKASEFISTLSPYPGRYFSDPSVKDFVRSPETVQGITPDVQIVKLDDYLYVLPIDNYIPRLRMNPHYINLMRDKKNSLDAESKKWIQKRYTDAADLLSSITQRGRTIERVTEAIFEVQSEFLTHGAQSIKPLTLKTVAEMAGVHESTVSRVTSNKYVQTPLGTYPMKFFFSNQLSTTHGKSVSSEQVKAEIKKIFRNEDSAKPISDQSVSTSLKQKGMIVARRTVQKYREELGILSSRQRKKV